MDKNVVAIICHVKYVSISRKVIQWRMHSLKLLGQAVKFIGLLLLVTTSNAQASVESVAPLSGGTVWNNNWIRDAIYSSADAACTAPQSTEISGSLTYVGTAPNPYFQGYLNCMFIYIPWGTTQVSGTAIPVSNAVCPVPTVNPTIQYKYDPVTKMCQRTLHETYELKLTPETATIEPGETYSFTATVTKQGGGAPSEPIPVSVKVEVDPASGGHDHGEKFAKRDKGSVSPAAGNKVLSFKFTATPVSGEHYITATCEQCVNKTATATVKVKVPDLTTLTSSSAYALVGGEPGKKHTDNHYLSAKAKGRLEKIVDEYNQAYPKGPLLRLNDASLEWGGKFDIAGKWVGAHAEHRRGVVIDIRANLDATAIPEIRFFDFEDIAAENGAEAELHCSKVFSEYIVGCIADSGSNRHFHVRLLGENARF